MASTDPAAVATAATLRHVAQWGLAFDNGPARDELMDIADQVEQIEDDIGCCPVCEEVACDDDCPLYAVRLRLGHWIQ